MKYILSAGLCAMVGMISGFLISRNYPPAPVVINGYAHSPCGLAGIAMDFWASVAGYRRGLCWG